ncbi:BON domain-containing protein [Rhizobiaceae bacterium n13]|uniref:BON domain-containing protein n=1 Tax=Ferirhizobium litorale TaxID=2927786 RepID=A0AAE3U1D7_9HYPH|nr:BON domain-containing protein [Fererhizobium litorale]MDI7863467.1 BON domain-containing protein [Fererhizobium litorale]MDI7922256.1 BON domain-containing protein [Fererhizobium litorale]
MVMVFTTSHTNVDDKQAHCRWSLQAAVKNALEDAEGLDASGIEVRVLGKFVILDGHVGSRAEAHRAAELAEDLAGNACVLNRILVRWQGLVSQPVVRG